jgi:hypothetical protein
MCFFSKKKSEKDSQFFFSPKFLGIDYTHPALGGCFGKGCKVAYGYDLVGNDFNGFPNTIKESDDPMDNCPSNSSRFFFVLI